MAHVRCVISPRGECTGVVRRLVFPGAALALLSLVSLLGASPAAADFGQIELQSVGQFEQFASAQESAISEDGRYLAFEGTLGGLKGIYRKDLETGQLQLVAGGSIYEGSGPTDAYAPSISADGRYVSFTSSKSLVKAARSGSNVYVRDMETPAPAGGDECDEEEEKQENGRRCGYELASALSGSDEGLAYGSEGSIGAIASGRVALSASGREVAFVIGTNSDLTSHEAAQLTTPRLQVAVRFLDTRETVLVSVERDPSSGAMTASPVQGGAVTVSAPGIEGSPKLPRAALSGDGSTVAWLGAHIPEQAPTLSGEGEQIEHDDGTPEPYDEPLWRRIEDRSSAPTRRMVGGGDPLAPGCQHGATIEVPACQGPYPRLAWEETRGGQGSNNGWLGITAYDGTPQLSYDGWTAALIGDPDGSSNVYVVNMREGLDRVQALRQVTREIPVANVINPGTNSNYVAGAGDVYELAISPDASRIAFTTQRQQFPLAPPNFTETPPAQLGVVELYQIDLAGESLVRVTHGRGDGPSLEGNSTVGGVTSHGAASPSYAGDDRVLAFADTATNLVAGDANGASDAFTVADVASLDLPGPVEAGPVSSMPEPVAQWRLSVVAVARRDGSVTLQVNVPGAGELSAAALATVPVSARVARSHRAGSARGRHKKPAASIDLQTRTVAAGRMAASLASTLELPLHVSSRYASLLATKAGIYASIHVTFKGTGGPPISQNVTVSLHRAAAKRTKRRASRAGAKQRIGVRAKRNGRGGA